MSTEIAGLVFTVAGSGTAWGTARTASGITSSDPLWWSPTISETLKWPEVSITEKAKLFDGDLDVDSITLRLLDDGTLGAFFLIDAATNTSTPITASVTAGATTISVGSGALFTAPCDAWIERECVRVTAVASNDLTVTRARYGTQAVAHTIDNANNRTPEMFTRPPWLGVQRHAYLWAVRAATGVAFPIWIGQTKRPRVDGAEIVLECEHLWSVLRNLRVGEYYGNTQLVGVGAPDAQQVAEIRMRNTDPDALIRAFAASPVYLDALEAVQSVLSRATAGAAAKFTATWSPTVGAIPSVIPRGATACTAQLAWTGTPNDLITGSLRLVGIEAPVQATYHNNNTTRLLRWDLTDLPQCAYLIGVDQTAASTLGVNSVTTLPTTWDGSSTTTEGRVTRANRVLRGTLNDEWWVVFNGIVVDASLPTITAVPSLLRRDPGAADLTTPQTITQPLLEVVLQVSADHWAEGWRYGVVPELARDTWADHWDWTRITSIVRNTTWPGSRRVSYYDSSAPVGELLTTDCLLTGCTPVVRSGGRLSLWDWRLPDAGDTSVATYTSTSIVGDVTPWDLYEDGLANSVTLRAEKLSIQVNLTQSFERYGRGREIQIELKNLDGERIRSIDPIALKTSLLRRLQLWSEPIYSVTLKVPGSELETVYVGDVITISEWMAPDGTGDRGLDSAQAVVWSRSLALTEGGELTLECLLFGRKSYPYSPAVVIEAQVSSTVYEVMDNPFNATSAYDGTSGSGLSRFLAGYKVQLIVRDSTTLTTEQAVIASIDTVSSPNRITFVDPLSAPMQALITGGSWVSVRFDRYNELVAVQKTSYAAVGDDTTDVIDGTNDRSLRIAP